MSKIAEAIYQNIIHEEFPTNAMGASSSTAGTGPVDTFDPMLGKKKKVVTRKAPKINLDFKKQP